MDASKWVERCASHLDTPLTLSPVNAASKGHLPVALYLLKKHRAEPLVRNNWGETAYDAAAAVFEVWICEVLLTLVLCFNQTSTHR